MPRRILSFLFVALAATAAVLSAGCDVFPLVDERSAVPEPTSTSEATATGSASTTLPPAPAVNRETALLDILIVKIVEAQGGTYLVVDRVDYYTHERARLESRKRLGYEVDPWAVNDHEQTSTYRLSARALFALVSEEEPATSVGADLGSKMVDLDAFVKHWRAEERDPYIRDDLVQHLWRLRVTDGVVTDVVEIAAGQ